MNAKDCEKRAEECLEMMNSATGTSKITLRELAQNWLILADQARLHDRDRSKERTVPKSSGTVSREQ